MPVTINLPKKSNGRQTKDRRQPVTRTYTRRRTSGPRWPTSESTPWRSDASETLLPKPATGEELVEALRRSGGIGMWAHIEDTEAFARNLRRMSDTRVHESTGKGDE